MAFILWLLGKFFLFYLYLPSILCFFFIVWELRAFLFLTLIHFFLPKLIDKLIIIYNRSYRFLELAFEDPITEVILFKLQKLLYLKAQFLHRKEDIIDSKPFV